jgi:hypothetical protein
MVAIEALAFSVACAPGAWDSPGRAGRTKRDLVHQSIEIALEADSHYAATIYTALGFLYALAGDVGRDHDLRQEAYGS